MPANENHEMSDIQIQFLIESTLSGYKFSPQSVNQVVR